MNENKKTTCPNDNMPESYWEDKPKRDCDLSNPGATIINNNDEPFEIVPGVLSE